MSEAIATAIVSLQLHFINTIRRPQMNIVQEYYDRINKIIQTI
ncbi:unnamed protein product, partial [marine sediment metagenome]